MPGLGQAGGFGAGDRNDRLDFDFYEERWVDELTDLNHCGGGTNGAEELAVGTTDRLPLGDVGDEHTGTDNVMKRCACLLESGLDGTESLNGL